MTIQDIPAAGAIRARRIGAMQPPDDAPPGRPRRTIAPGTDSDWQARAACSQTGPGPFFPEIERADAAPVTAAKRVCASCPVAAACLRYALRTDQRHGIWGGLTTPERDAAHRRGKGRRGAAR